MRTFETKRYYVNYETMHEYCVYGIDAVRLKNCCGE